MKKIINFIIRLRSLKMWADKHQFTLKFNVLDAPNESTQKCIAKFYPRSGFKRYIKLLFGKESDYIAFYLTKTKTKQNEAEFNILFECDFGKKRRDLISGISPGQVNILTLTLAKEIHIRLNNRITTHPVDLSEVSSGYRVYKINKEMSVDVWIVKLI